jgi:protein-disulfide isomerase
LLIKFALFVLRAYTQNIMTTNKGFLTVPLAIIVAGIIIGLSVIYAVGQNKPAGGGGLAYEEEDVDSASIDDLRPVDATDHILGNVDAPVKIVEFSDPECPFCKRFHFTMKQVMKEYDGRVAWVYRHFPLSALHMKAQSESEAIECAGEVGGNVKFWAYLDRLMDITPSNDGLPEDELPKIASYVGLDLAKFESCRKSGRATARVDRDAEDAANSGGQGTPYSVVIGPTGKKYPISGAYPFDDVKRIIDKALAEK